MFFHLFELVLVTPGQNTLTHTHTDIHIKKNENFILSD